MNLIVAVDEKWAIGYKGDLLCYIPTDLKYFKEITTNKIMILGRKTLESFPKGEPLPNRHHFLLSKGDHPMKNHPQVTLCNSVEVLMEKIKDLNQNDIFVVGGGEIYNTMLPFCNKAYITKIHKSFKADTFFPNLDENSQWEFIGNNEFLPIIYEKDKEKLDFDFQIYMKK